MQWLIQNSGITFASLEANVAPLIRALDGMEERWSAIGYAPDAGVITGVENIDRGVPTFLYGSTRIAELAASYGFRPGAFYNPQWFDPGSWLGKRRDLLNCEQQLLTVSALRRDWISSPVFLKSVDPKVLTGMVLEGRSDADWWLEEYAHLRDEDVLILSPVRRIVQEWRFFVVGGRVVAGSQYKHDGVLRIREPIAAAVWDEARRMAQDWLPSENIVMDICLTGEGRYCLLEFNCLNAAGFYNADVASIVQALKAIPFTALGS